MGRRLVWARAVLKPKVASRAVRRAVLNQAAVLRPAVLRRVATPRVGFRQAVAALVKRSAVPPVVVL
jgi:hypothetical protein